jgi:hypothetical protein
MEKGKERDRKKTKLWNQLSDLGRIRVHYCNILCVCVYV